MWAWIDGSLALKFRTLHLEDNMTSPAMTPARHKANNGSDLLPPPPCWFWFWFWFWFWLLVGIFLFVVEFIISICFVVGQGPTHKLGWVRTMIPLLTDTAGLRHQHGRSFSLFLFYSGIVSVFLPSKGFLLKAFVKQNWFNFLPFVIKAGADLQKVHIGWDPPNRWQFSAQVTHLYSLQHNL